MKEKIYSYEFYQLEEICKKKQCKTCPKLTVNTEIDAFNSDHFWNKKINFC